MKTRDKIHQHLKAITDPETNVTPQITGLDIAVQVGRSTAGTAVALRELTKSGVIEIADRNYGPNGGTVYRVVR